MKFMIIKVTNYPYKESIKNSEKPKKYLNRLKF